MKPFPVFFSLLFLNLFSCGNEVTTVELNLVFDKPLIKEKYPTYFKDITAPYNTECDKSILLKPINVVRLDIKNSSVETNAWYFENVGENTVEFSKNWLKQYFTDSIVSPYLTLPAKKQINKEKFEHYISSKKDNLYIFSEDSDIDNYKGIPVLHSAKEVNKLLKLNACSNFKEKVFVYINPKELIENSNPPPPPDTTSVDPCNIATVTDALDLKQDMLLVIDAKLSINDRVQKGKEIFEKYFDKNAYVASYLDTTDNNPEVWNPGEAKQYFTGRIAMLNSITDINIFRIERSKVNNKITGIKLVECHNASQLVQ